MGIECDDQPIRWIRIRTTPLAIRDGIHALLFTDITDERLVNLQNELVLEASGIGIQCNLQTHDLQWDSSMYQLYGVNVDDFTGDYDAWRKTLHPDDIQRCEDEIAAAVDGTKRFDTSFRILIDGVKYIQAKATISTDANGQPHIMIGTSWDITESKNREEELNALGEVKDRFIATMSHEVRTPLNGIIGMSEVIGRSVDDPQVREHVASLTQCAHHLNGLITEILDFSKLKSGKISFSQDVLHVATIVKDVVHAQSTRLPDGVSAQVAVAGNDAHLVVADQVRLTQVIANLVNNAVKFTMSGHVLVTVDQRSAGEAVSLKVSVKDTGLGFRRAARKHL